MKKLWMGIALGVMAGCLLSDVPQVKQAVDFGKEKVTKLFK